MNCHKPSSCWTCTTSPEQWESLYLWPGSRRTLPWDTKNDNVELDKKPKAEMRRPISRWHRSAISRCYWRDYWHHPELRKEHRGPITPKDQTWGTNLHTPCGNDGTNVTVTEPGPGLEVLTPLRWRPRVWTKDTRTPTLNNLYQISPWGKDRWSCPTSRRRDGALEVRETYGFGR